jgi:PhoPQ-activated pathogenicity-related protein
MDCVQELMAGKEGGGLQIEKFVVAGASKRGWTTWMTGVADPRVEAIVPIVIDVLNVDPSMRHHAAVYGFWAEAIGDYVQHDITSRWGHPRMQEIYEAVDPYYHLDRLAMPKFIVNASGDQFFCPDSSQFYFHDLHGEKHLRYVPNADHSLRDSDAVESIAAFYQMVVAGKPRPRFSWVFEGDGSIRVTTDDKPNEVRLWQATNPKARDFRLKTIGAAFTSSILEDQGEGVFVGRIDPPNEGWTAFFVELNYDTGMSLPLKLTTAVRVSPNTLPHSGIDVSNTPYEREIKESR